MKDTSVAPIVLFVYNRLFHTQQTLNALVANELASESDLFIYSDAPKNEDSVLAVKAVRDFIQTVNGFKSVTIIERSYNHGLASSIIDGVTSIVNKYGKIIVLEDDIVTSPFFLQYMNSALNFYQDEPRVMHISGWNYPVKFTQSRQYDAFLWRLMNCWGWGTWASSWCHFEKNPSDLCDKFTSDMKQVFNLDGYLKNNWREVEKNIQGSLDTWAIFWYASIYINQGLCLNPYRSYCQNIGLDGSGINCIKTSQFNVDLSKSLNTNFPSIIQESTRDVARIKKYFLLTRFNVLRRIQRILAKYVF